MKLSFIKSIKIKNQAQFSKRVALTILNSKQRYRKGQKWCQSRSVVVTWARLALARPHFDRLSATRLPAIFRFLKLHPLPHLFSRATRRGTTAPLSESGPQAVDGTCVFMYKFAKVVWLVRILGQRPLPRFRKCIFEKPGKEGFLGLQLLFL